MTKTKRITLTLFALIGLALSIELCVVYYNANFAIDAKPSICAISETMDCDSVARTSYSQFFGIPLSFWGVILYIFLLFMTFVDKLKNLKFLGFLKVFKNPESYIFCVFLFSFVVSMILGCISVFKINSICIFCFMTYFLDFIVAIVSKTKGNSIISEFKISIADFIEALNEKKYLILFLIFVILASGVLVYTSYSNIFSPQIIRQTEMLKSFKLYKNHTSGTTMGPEDAEIVVHEYMDFNCGGCFLANIYLHRIVSEFSNVKVIQHNVPLDKQCNHNMKTDGHKNSCLKSSYALAAAKQNLYWQMSEILFDPNVETEKDILEAARLVMFDVKKLKSDANSEEIKNEILESIKDADSKNVDGTPTMFIGIRTILGVSSYPSLKQIIIDQGGKEKVNG